MTSIEEESTTTTSYDRYRIQICMGDEVIHKLALPSRKTRLQVVEFARRELAHTSTATHALVRGLNGCEIEVFTSDSWLRCQMKALSLK